MRAPGTPSARDSFRDNCCGFKGSAPSQNSAQSNLTTLPASWTKGKVWPTDGPASLFADH